MKTESYKCDGCGKEKQQTNHWFAVEAMRDCLIIVAFGESLNRGGTWEHFCGESCVLKMVARNLPK